MKPAPVLTTLVVAVALLFFTPFAYLAVRGIEGGGGLFDTLTSLKALASLGRSVVLGGAVALASTVVGVATAWLVTRTDVPGRGVWRLLLPLPLVIPSYIGAFVMLGAFAQGGLLEALLRPLGVGEITAFGGFTGSFLVLSLFTFPYVYLPVQARLRQLPPSFEESARLLGTRPFGAFFSVVLPQTRGAILAGSLLVFLYTISDFGVVQLMRYDTLTRVIYSTRLIDSITSIRLSLMLGLLAILVVVTERIVARGDGPVGAPRGSRPLQIPLRRWSAAAVALLSCVVGFSLVAPVSVLAWWALRSLARGDLSGSMLVADLSDMASPALNTSLASVAAAVTAIVLVAPVAYFTIRRPGSLGSVANAVIVGGFALPGLSIALSLVYFTLSGPSWIAGVYQTLPLLVLAYVVHFGAQAMGTARVAVSSVPRRVEDAARTLGVNKLQSFIRVELPLMMPGLLAGAGLVLLSAMKELPATLLLSPIGFETLSVKIWTGTQSARFADASLASLVLILTSGVLTWWLVIRRSDRLV